MTQRRGRGARARVAWWALVAAMVWASPVRAQDAARRVPLSEVLAYAEHHAPRVVIARARVEEADAEREGAEPLLRDPLRLELAAGPRVPEQGGADLDALVALSQPIEVAGERGARLDRAAAIERRRAAALDEARWEAHREVHYAFHEAIEMRVRAEAAVRWNDLARALLEVARARATAGDVGGIDVIVGEAELARSAQALIAARHAYEAAMWTVCELSGWPSADPPHPAGELDAPRAIVALDDLLARALAHHPALASREAAIEEARASAVLADREAWPTLDLGVSLAREGSAGSPANYVGLLTIGIGLPIWQQAALERAQARAAIVVADAEVEALRGQIEARVRRARAAAIAAAERVEVHRRDVLPRLEQVLQAIRGAYELGEIDALAVATVRRQLMEAEDGALEAFAGYHRALADLEAEVGAEVVADPGHEEAR